MSVMRAAVTVGGFTLLSRVIGFLRECVMAFCLGAGIYTDALLVAMRLANTFRRIFAEGAFNSSFLPRFSKVLSREGQESANVVLSDVFCALLIILTAFCTLIVLIFPSFLKIIVSGFDILSEKFQLTVILGRICFPYLILISIASLFSGVLNAVNKFALAAAMHSILSLFTMSGMLLGYFLGLSHSSTVRIVTVFVLLSGVTQSLILFSGIKKCDFKVKFRTNFWSEKVQDILRNMIPGIIGAGVWQLNLLVDTTISSYLPVGTITCMSLADRLNQFPLGTLGIALSTALLPVLSKHIGVGNFKEAAQELRKGLLFAFFLTFLATTLLIALSEPTVAVAFQRGLFGADKVRITADALAGFAIGLPAYVLTKVFSTVYFAYGDTKTPVIFAAISVFLNAVFVITLVPFLKYFGMAMGTSLSALSNAFMLVIFCGKDMKTAIKAEMQHFNRVLAQLCGAIAAYAVGNWLKALFWNSEIGDSIMKWLVYCGFSVIIVTVYFIFTMLILRTTGCDWKLWRKETWR